MNVQNIQNYYQEIPPELIPELSTVIQNYLSGKLRERLNSRTLGVFCNEYLTHVRKNLSNKYYLSTRLSLKHLTSFLNADVRLNDINPREVDLFLSEVKKAAPRGYLVYY